MTALPRFPPDLRLIIVQYAPELEWDQTGGGGAGDGKGGELRGEFRRASTVVLDLRLVMLLLLRLLFGSAPMDQLEDDDDDDNVLPGRAPYVICIFHSVLQAF